MCSTSWTHDWATLTKPMTSSQRESAKLDSDDPRIARTVECIMMFLNGSGVLEGADDPTVVEAIAIVHSELKAMLEGGDTYRDALKSVADGTEHPAFVLVLLTETCVRKIDILRDGWTELPPQDMREIRQNLGLSTHEMGKALRLGWNGARTVRRYEAGELAPSGQVTLLYQMYEEGTLWPCQASGWLHDWRPNGRAE